MGTARITYDKLETNAYNNIHSIIDTRTNVGDPKDPSNIRTRQFVHTADPNTKSLNFNGYPYIILKFPMLEKSNSTADGKSMKVMWTQSIIVRTTKSGSGDSTDNAGKNDMFNISDDLHQTFDSLTIKQQMKDLNMTFVDIKKLNIDEVTLDQQTEFEAEFELTYWIRMQVSV